MAQREMAQRVDEQGGEEVRAAPEGEGRELEESPAACGGLDSWLLWTDPSTNTPLRRTLVMRAAREGSLPVLKLLLSAGAAVDLQSPDDGVTALHAAASCTNVTSAMEAIQMLLKSGANRETLDWQGRRPLDYFMGAQLSDANQAPCAQLERDDQPQPAAAMERKQHAARPTSDVAVPAVSDLATTNDQVADMLHSADFRMYRFKVEECPHTDLLHDHDWTECPFAHPGEKARRRDPRKYSYSSTTCPDFRKGSCKRGELCPYAHGVFECWLHPSKYRTQLCKEAGACSRSVCWFAHSIGEMRLPPAQPSLSSSASLGNLHGDDQWGLPCSNPDHPRSAVSASGTSALLSSSVAGSMLSSGPAANWATQGMRSLDGSPGSEQLNSLMDQLKVNERPAAAAVPLNSAFCLPQKTNPLFTPPMSPGCSQRGTRNTSSPGMTPSYQPASPQNDGSPSRQHPSRLAVASAQARGRARSLAQQCSRMMPAAGLGLGLGLQQEGGGGAPPLPQFMPQLLQVDQLALMRQQSQHQRQRQHQSLQQQFMHQASRAVASGALNLNLRGPVQPQAVMPNPLMGHEALLWPEAACDRSMLDLSSLAQLANSLYAEAPDAMGPAAWCPAPDASISMFGEPPDTGRAVTLPGHSWGRAVSMDQNLAAAMSRPRSFTLPNNMWSHQEPLMGHHDRFINQPEALQLQAQASYFSMHH